MSDKRVVGVAILATFLVIVGSLYVAGCASAPSAYKTLSATESTVDAALQAFADARVHGHVADADYSLVAQAYSRYQLAFQDAFKAARLSPQGATPKQVSDLAIEVIMTVNQILGRSTATPGTPRGGGL